MIAALADRLAARGVPMLADPKRSPFRIYRDTRFSKDKSPYKTHLGASFPWVEAAPGTEAVAATRSAPTATAAISISSPARCTSAAGCGRWRRRRSRRSATQCVDDPDRVRAALEAPAFVAWFGDAHGHDELQAGSRRAIPADHPMADMFRWKDVVFGRRLADEEVLSPDLPDRLAEGYATADAGVPFPRSGLDIGRDRRGRVGRSRALAGASRRARPEAVRPAPSAPPQKIGHEAEDRRGERLLGVAPEDQPEPDELERDRHEPEDRSATSPARKVPPARSRRAGRPAAGDEIDRHHDGRTDRGPGAPAEDSRR